MIGRRKAPGSDEDGYAYATDCREWRVFDRIGADDYEQVVFCHHRATGLRAIVAIHSTALGPALGGTRFYPYASEDGGLRRRAAPGAGA